MELTYEPPVTAWETGRLDRRAGPRQLLFGRMYEDVEIELAVFPPGGNIFCIASAGCTAMQLAQHHQVVAVDINPVQVAYVRQRLAGGPMQLGRADRMMAHLRALGPLAGWSRRAVRAFCDFDNVDDQVRYWQRHLDTCRLRAAFAFLFSQPVLRSFYSSSLLERLPPKLGTVLRRRMERCFRLHANRTNPYARALFLGEMPPPPPAPEVGSIRLVCADAASFLEGQPAESFTGFSLSNILDGANAAYERRLLAAVRHAAAPGAVAVLRSFREPVVSARVNHAAEDRWMFWGVVDIF